METLDDIPFSVLSKLYDALKVVTDDMVDAGIGHNHRHNHPDNLVSSYKEMLDYSPVFKRLFAES